MFCNHRVSRNAYICVEFVPRYRFYRLFARLRKKSQYIFYVEGWANYSVSLLYYQRRDFHSFDQITGNQPSREPSRSNQASREPAINIYAFSGTNNGFRKK